MGSALRQTLQIGTTIYHYVSLPWFAQTYGIDLSQLPYSLKVLLENLLRHASSSNTQADIAHTFSEWIEQRHSEHEIDFYPTRVLMQDLTGVPAVVDLAAMREAMMALKGDPERINPMIPVDLVVDHSVMADYAGTSDAFKENVHLEYDRNGERYAFLKWAQSTFRNFRVVPPGTGICHQVNLEYLAKVVWTQADEEGDLWAYPDTLVGTDSHTTMVNGLSVLGWGVGGIEAEAAMLGQPLSMILPEVIGVHLSGRLSEGATATDLVLTITQLLRTKGVVGKFVEFFGTGVAELTLADRATVANMAPEYGATCGFFPIDAETLSYLRGTGRSDEHVSLVEHYAQDQTLWFNPKDSAVYTDILHVDLKTIEPSVAGPKRPQDRIILSQVPDNFKLDRELQTHPVLTRDYALGDGAVVIAAITSCTNTSNPTVMLGAGLLAQKAVERGLMVAPWVKTSLAPGSQVVSDYLEAAGLQESLNHLGFQLVGYGCTTCIGNSGALEAPIAETIQDHDLHVCAVLSGNRNFEGRIHPLVQSSYLASPPLVVAYALTGSIKYNLLSEPLGKDPAGKPVYLKDIWPSREEIQELKERFVVPRFFISRAQTLSVGEDNWQAINPKQTETYQWNERSTYVKHPPYFKHMSLREEATPHFEKMHLLAILGDGITTDHISPAGSIPKESPAGRYLEQHGVELKDFNSYGARRGNHEVMMRGTFANIRLQNLMMPEKKGGYTRLFPSRDVVSIYDAAQHYQQEGTPLVIIAGKDYGAGSSRDWAAKGPALLGVKAVIAESFERIHRSNLVGMGVLPFTFLEGHNAQTLGLKGGETFSIYGFGKPLTPRQQVTLEIQDATGQIRSVPILCRIETENEVAYFQNGGILQYVLRSLVA